MKAYFIILLCCLPFIAISQNLSGSADHAIISRYPGAEIKFYYTQDYSEVEIPTAIVDAKPSNIELAKGKHTSILYAAPKGVSVLEIFRNYEQAIKKANGKILFSCKGKYAPEGCDDYKKFYALKFFEANYYQKRYNNTDQYILMNGSDDQAFLVAVFEDREKKVFLEIGIDGDSFGDQSGIQQEVVEVSKMKDGLLTAESFEEEINKNGKIALYGILFDTGKATLKAESINELSLVQEYLINHPEVKVYIVGHTDDTGSLGNNIDLSNQRAQAVVKHLTDNGISSDRLNAYGVGPYSPESTNDSEEGRKLNRRVEIVKALK